MAGLRSARGPSTKSVKSSPRSGALAPLPKAHSGIEGLDQITDGGLPRGRPTLVCGSAGCGKTLFALEFLIRGAIEHGEPGVFVSFEETEADLSANVASLGFDLPALIKSKKLVVDHVHVERSEIEETGEYDLEGLFVRMQLAIDEVGAKRVAIDTIESLFAALPNEAVLRSELRRLFRWLKDRGQTVVITGERGEGALTRHGLEEYVSDCVIFLDHRINDQISTRRLRVVKYRGSMHGTNEYAFLIGDRGFSVLPITSLGLTHKASAERVSSGIPRLDAMLGGKGYFKGSTILITGTAGTGKTSLSAYLARDVCSKGGGCLYLAFEESPDQILRNMRSIGVDLEPFVRSGKLVIASSRPHAHGLEMHLAMIHKQIEQLSPSLVIVDPITNLTGVGSTLDARLMLTRLIDYLKTRGTTTLFTSLTSGSADIESTDVGISSMIDTWLMLEIVRSQGERNRTLNIIKSRGMAHSNQTSEYTLSSDGIRILDTYVGPSGVVTGSARLALEAEDLATFTVQKQEIARLEAVRENRRKAFDARVTALNEEFLAEDAALRQSLDNALARAQRLQEDRTAMAHSRSAFAQEQQSRPRKAGR